jgi:hypothetical protein
MRRVLLVGLLLAACGSAFAAPNVTNATQKGSLLIFPDIRVDNDPDIGGLWNTIVRIQNDQSASIDVKCYWMDGNKHRVDWVFPMTRNQPIWFDALNGFGTVGANRFPQSIANGFDNPFLITPPAQAEEDDTGGAHLRGMLACWAVSSDGSAQVKWNHLSGTATVFHPVNGAYEYSAYAFFAPVGQDKDPIGIPGIIKMDGVEYDSCPQYQIAQFPTGPINGAMTSGRRLAIVGCTLYLNQDWLPVWTKYTFDAWNSDDVKLTGSFRCADSWHESPSGTDPLMNTGMRFRVQSVVSTQCSVNGVPIVTQQVGVLAVQSTRVEFLGANPHVNYIGTTLTSAGKFSGRIIWDAFGGTPEGGIR